MLMIDIEIPGRRLSSHLSKQSLVFEIILFIDSSKKHPLRSLSFFLPHSFSSNPIISSTREQNDTQKKSHALGHTTQPSCPCQYSNSTRTAHFSSPSPQPPQHQAILTTWPALSTSSSTRGWRAKAPSFTQASNTLDTRKNHTSHPSPTSSRN